MSDPSEMILRLYTLYDHPRDFPEWFVVRSHAVVRGFPDPLPEVPAFLFRDIDAAREWCLQQGLARMERSPEDDSKIVEVWL